MTASAMTRFRLWWEAMDAVLVQRGQPPLDYEEARLLFDCELKPEDVVAASAALGRAGDEAIQNLNLPKETDDDDTQQRMA